MQKKLKTDLSTTTASHDYPELHQYVESMGRSLLSISDAQCTQKLLGLQNQEFEVEMKLLDVIDERKKSLSMQL